VPHKVDTGLHQGADCHSLSCSLSFELCPSPQEDVGATHGGFTCKVLLRFLFFVLRTLSFTLGGRRCHTRWIPDYTKVQTATAFLVLCPLRFVFRPPVPHTVDLPAKCFCGSCSLSLELCPSPPRCRTRWEEGGRIVLALSFCVALSSLTVFEPPLVDYCPGSLLLCTSFLLLPPLTTRGR